MGNYYVKITVEDIDIASNFFENDKHLDEFIANVSRYYCQKPITIKTKIVKRYFESYKKTMDRVMANRINGKKGGEQNIKNQVDTNNSLEAPLEALVEAPLQGKLIEVKEVNKVKKNNIEERKLKFASTLEPFKAKYGRDLLNQFYKYWTEPNKSNSKFKQELEKTWSLERRLETWSNNDKSFGKKEEPVSESKGKLGVATFAELNKPYQ